MLIAQRSGTGACAAIQAGWDQRSMPTIRRTYGRPRPLLVEECAVVRSELERFRLPTGALAQHEDVIRLIVTWSTGERRLLDLRVLVTASAVGKAKRWFACPHCRRRVGRLYAPSADQPFACRHCWHLRYASQYRPPSQWDRRLGDLWATLAPRQRRPVRSTQPGEMPADVSHSHPSREPTRSQQDTASTGFATSPNRPGSWVDDFGGGTTG